jgi:hypothetical protein
MKLSFYALLLFCVSASAAQGQKDKNEPRVLSVQSFYKAGDFLEMGENPRMLYVSGLMDGFYASTFFGASDEAIAALTSCTRGMDNRQLSAIVTKYVKDHPEVWHLSMSMESYNALSAACPGILKVVNGKS